MKNTVKLGVHNKFEIKVIRDGTTIQEGFAENIVLNRMYTRLVNLNNFFTNIVFGTGTGILDPTRTTLFNRIGNESAQYVDAKITGNILEVTRKATLSLESYNGSTLTEVGISETTVDINTHALIKDAEGNPISISKTDLDIIKIYATVYLEVQDDAIASFNLDSSNGYLYQLFVNNSSMTVSSKIMVSLDDSISKDINTYGAGTETELITPTSHSVAVDSVAKTTKISGRIGVDSGNSAGGISRIQSEFLASLKIWETNPINYYTKSDVVLGVGDGSTINFNIPNKSVTDLIVKVDGVATTGYTYENERKVAHIFEILPDASSEYRDELFVYGNPHRHQVAGGSTTTRASRTFASIPYNNTVVDLSNYKLGMNNSRNCTVYLEGSNDETTFTTICQVSDSSSTPMDRTSDIPITVNDYSYLRIYYTITASYNHPYLSYIFFEHKTKVDKSRIVFNTAPALDAVVTADYKMPYIPKDIDHVIDYEITLQWGEYTP